MDSKESIPPAYVAWRRGLSLRGSQTPVPMDCSKIPVQETANKNVAQSPSLHRPCEK
jgi:hypothetical protein